VFEEECVRYRTYSIILVGRRVSSISNTLEQSSGQNSVFEEECVRYRTQSNSLVGRLACSKKSVFDIEHAQSSR